MSQNKMYDLIIVGGGPGGLTAGIYAMRAALKTVLIEKGLTGGQMTMSDEVSLMSLTTAGTLMAST